MNKKLKKLRNRMVQSIQQNYTIRNSQDKNKSFSHKQKFKTIASEKIQTINANKFDPNRKRVYLNSANHSTLYPNITLVCSEKEEIAPTPNLETQHRYINRVKSSNATNPNNWPLVKDISMRKTLKEQKILKDISKVQFQSQLYWNGNSSYLVTGVKNQYEKIKKNYQQKCLQIQKIKKQYKVDALKQLKIYIDKLQKQNSKLIEACTKYRRKINKPNQINTNIQNLILQNYRPKDPQQIQREYELKIEKFQQKIQNLKKKNTRLTCENKKLSTKIFLQEKMIIQKDNAQFKIESRSKRVEKQLIELKQSYNKNQQKVKQDFLKAQQKVNQVKMTLKEQFGLQKKILLDKIRQKDNRIQKYQKQISHLRTLLQHWKHGDYDQLQEQSDQVLQHAYEKQQHLLQRVEVSKIYIESNMKNQNDEKNKQKVVERIKLNFKNSIENDIPMKKDSDKSNIPSQRSINRSIMRIRTNDGKNSARSTQKTIIRERVTAKTHKKDSIRCRPVQLNQVQSIVEYLKLKLAFKRINLQDIKQFFKYQKNINPVQQQNLDKQNQEISWEQQYISIKQVYDVFLKQPFSIQETEALLLSRFIIEDVKEPYVYMNWDSQNSRRMVESIIFNLLAFNEINDSTIQKSQDLLKKYETVLIPALKTVTGRTGKISKDKFIEILNGLGLQRTKYMDDYIIGKMCNSSHSLDDLIFSTLYQEQNKKEQGQIQ